MCAIHRRGFRGDACACRKDDRVLLCVNCARATRIVDVGVNVAAYVEAVRFPWQGTIVANADNATVLDETSRYLTSDAR